MTIEVVAFDVGGVLEVVDDATWPERWTEHWAAELGIEVAEWHARMARYDLAGTSTGLVTEAEMAEAYQSALGVSDRQLRPMLEDLWDRYCGRLDTALMEYAERLLPSYRLAIISNSGDGARREEEKRYGFARLFDPIIYSHEVGVAKPDPAIWALTCDRTGAEPGSIVLADDGAVNVASAAEFGMHAIHHTSTPATIAALGRLLA